MSIRLGSVVEIESNNKEGELEKDECHVEIDITGYVAHLKDEFSEDQICEGVYRMARRLYGGLMNKDGRARANGDALERIVPNLVYLVQDCNMEQCRLIVERYVSETDGWSFTPAGSRRPRFIKAKDLWDNNSRVVVRMPTANGGEETLEMTHRTEVKHMSRGFYGGGVVSESTSYLTVKGSLAALTWLMKNIGEFLKNLRQVKTIGLGDFEELYDAAVGMTDEGVGSEFIG